MIESFQIGSLTFHIYGLIMGVAVVVGLRLLEFQFKRAKLVNGNLWKIILMFLIGALLGARLWHVMTDWQLYTNQLILALYIWNGGLSIIGALMGSTVVLWLTKKYTSWFVEFSIFHFTDALAYVLPISQAIGRLGNWINQELYGLPTNLPWKIAIDTENRLPGFANQTYYHPLFAYEALLLTGFAAIMWYLQRRRPALKLGTGLPTLIYLAFLSLTRFVLEFLRIDKPGLTWMNISINQLISLIIFLISIHLIFKFHQQKK